MKCSGSEGQAWTACLALDAGWVLKLLLLLVAASALEVVYSCQLQQYKNRKSALIGTVTQRPMKA